jgi:O-antigen ligase
VTSIIGAAERPAPASLYVQALLVAALGWGAFSFGAVYPWAYWPLAAALVIAAVGGLACGASSSRLPQLWWLSATFSLFGAAILFQLVPLPLAFLPTVSAHALDVLGQLDVTVANGTAAAHAISIRPSSTVTAAMLFAAFSLAVLGSACLVSIRGPRGLAQALTVVGALLALAAIVQRPVFGAKIYGFWMPQSVGAVPFGPFVNKNHFAGWMLMALPVTIGLLCAGVARGMQGTRPAWRARILWFASPAASRMVLLAAAAALMALSLVMTMSRAGIAAFMLATTATSLVVLRRQRTKARKTVVLAYLATVVVAAFAWVGTDAIVMQFASADWSEINGRRGLWSDALAIASRFPLTGTGLNTYGAATLFYQEHDLALHYNEAHNDYLQLLAEGGALLMVPALLCAGVFVHLVRSRFRDERSTTSYWLRVGAVTGIAAIALQETVEFSLQMPGNAALFSVLCGMAIHRAPRRERPARSAHAPGSPAPHF